MIISLYICCNLLYRQSVIPQQNARYYRRIYEYSIEYCEYCFAIVVCKNRKPFCSKKCTYWLKSSFFENKCNYVQMHTFTLLHD